MKIKDVLENHQDEHYPDKSPFICHFTKPTRKQSAFQVLQSIIEQGQIWSGTGFVLGLHNVVCFSETPLRLIRFPKDRYHPYGLIFWKREIFNLGGRPVIYQPRTSYGLLPEDQKFRHVTFDLLPDPPPEYGNDKDFTWEREWRLQDDVDLMFADWMAIVPSREEAGRLRKLTNCKNVMSFNRLAMHFTYDYYSRCWDFQG